MAAQSPKPMGYPRINGYDASMVIEARDKLRVAQKALGPFTEGETRDFLLDNFEQLKDSADAENFRVMLVSIDNARRGG